MLFNTALKINKFLHANNIKYINISGGEFICHPHWWQVLTVLVENIPQVRLVSNGDWAAHKQAQNVLEFLETNPQVYVALSKDRWHTNKYVDLAEELLKEEGIYYKVATQEETTTESIVPVGRSRYNYVSTMYNMFMRYCTKPENRYSFLIDEKGEIYKCPFGLWEYDNINNFLDGNFHKRFKEFTSNYYSTFISNCAACNRLYEMDRHKNK